MQTFALGVLGTLTGALLIWAWNGVMTRLSSRWRARRRRTLHASIEQIGAEGLLLYTIGEVRLWVKFFGSMLLGLTLLHHLSEWPSGGVLLERVNWVLQLAVAVAFISASLRFVHLASRRQEVRLLLHEAPDAEENVPEADGGEEGVE